MSLPRTPLLGAQAFGIVAGPSRSDPSTVTTDRDRLESARLITKVPRPRGRGPRAVRFELDPSAITIVSVTVVWDRIVAVCADGIGRIRRQAAACRIWPR